MGNLQISQVVSNGIEKLSSFQQKDGSFLSFSSNDENNYSHATSYQTTFLSSIILLASAALPSTKQSIFLKKNLANFLLSQKSEYWSWNYWKRNAKEAKTSPYPDDLDDTFCALAALSLYDKTLVTGEVFAHIVKLLTVTEEKEGGPYRTWLVKKTKQNVWMDVDFAVNSNVTYFLSLHDIVLPNMEIYFDSCIKKNKIKSPYYPSFHAPLYFLSRFYKGKYTEQLKNMLLETRDTYGSWGNPLKTAMAIVSLLNLGVAPEKLEQSIEYLLKTRKNTTWPAYGFCIDPSKNTMRYFAGSKALTTALCLESLQKYLLAKKQQKNKSEVVNDETEKQYYFQTIMKGVKKHFDAFDDDISLKADMMLERILKHDTIQQIPLLPYYFFQSLKKENKKITKNVLIKLGMANVFGWIAYTIFDDFLDEEGDPSLLPLALMAHRELTYIYDTFTLKKKRIQKLYNTFLNKIDMANMRELKNRHLVNENDMYRIIDALADKSIGHALGPLTILLLLGYTEESPEFIAISSFFIHVLIAKQLNDDAHDWEEDMKKGHITPIISLLLTKAKQKKLSKKQYLLKELFWKEIIPEVSLLINQHAHKAKTSFKQSRIIKDKRMLHMLLDAQVRSANRALEEQKKVTAFIQTYQHT